MTIASTSPRSQYTATSGQTVFAYPFEVFDQADLLVYLTPVGNTADDATDILVITTNYTVSGVGNDSGGNVTLVVGATTGDIITITRSVVIDRDTDAEDPAFVRECVDRLIDLIEK